MNINLYKTKKINAIMNSRFSKSFSRGLSVLLIGITGFTEVAGINGCATAEYYPKASKTGEAIAYNVNTSKTVLNIRNFLPKDETLRDITIRHRDYNNDGRFDFYDVLLTSTGSNNLIRMIEVVYKYTSEGKIMQNPIITYHIINWQENKNGKLVAITEKSQKHDCGTRKLSSESELPELITEYKPDGKFDFEATTHIELPFSIQIIPQQENQYKTPEQQLQKPVDPNKPNINPELEKKLKDLEKQGKSRLRTEV